MIRRPRSRQPSLRSTTVCAWSHTPRSDGLRPAAPTGGTAVRLSLGMPSLLRCRPPSPAPRATPAARPPALRDVPQVVDTVDLTALQCLLHNPWTAAVGGAELVGDLPVGAAVDRHLDRSGTPPRGECRLAVLTPEERLRAVLAERLVRLQDSCGMGHGPLSPTVFTRASCWVGAGIDDGGRAAARGRTDARLTVPMDLAPRAPDGPACRCHSGVNDVEHDCVCPLALTVTSTTTV